MEKTPTNLQTALALTRQLTSLESRTLQSALDTQLAKFIAADTGCRFLKISAELRNQVYEIVAAHQARVAICGDGRASGLARVNKQISKEYLSILKSEITISARYFDLSYRLNWVPIDVLASLNCRASALHEKGREPYQVRQLAGSFRTRPGQDEEIRREVSGTSTSYARSSFGATCEVLVELGGGKNGTMRFTVAKSFVDELCKRQKLAQ